MTFPNHRSRGFSVTEMLVVIGIFAVFALVATRLMHTTIRVGHDAGYAQIAATSFDAAGRTMRRDVWSARQVAVKNDGSLTLSMSDGTSVDWSVDDGGTFTRSVKSERPQKWETKAAGATIAAAGPAVVIRLPETKTSRGGELRFTSQLMLAGRMQS